MHVVTIEYDHDMENPAEFSDWKLYSFSTNHSSFKHPSDLGIGPTDKYGETKITNPGLRSKLKAGTAFILSYYEHGNSLWMLRGGDTPAGVEYMWDGVRTAGLLTLNDHWTFYDLEGKKRRRTFVERAKSAQEFLDLYNDFCNGYGYEYRIEDAESDEEEAWSCGFYGCNLEYMAEEILNELAGEPYVLKGEAAVMVEDYIALEQARRKVGVG